MLLIYARFKTHSNLKNPKNRTTPNSQPTINANYQIWFPETTIWHNNQHSRTNSQISKWKISIRKFNHSHHVFNLQPIHNLFTKMRVSKLFTRSKPDWIQYLKSLNAIKKKTYGQKQPWSNQTFYISVLKILNATSQLRSNDLHRNQNKKQHRLSEKKTAYPLQPGAKLLNWESTLTWFSSNPNSTELAHSI